MGEVIV